MSDPSLSPSSQPPSKPKARLKMALGWMVGVALLAWLLSHTPWSEVRAALARPSWGIWLLTLGGLGLTYVLRSARLQVVLGLETAPQPEKRFLGLRTDALRVILMHNAAVNLLPMRAGELTFPWLASRELNLPLPRAVACLLWMRVQDMLILMGLGLALWPSVPVTWRVAAIVAMIVTWQVAQWLLKRWSTTAAHSSPDHTHGRWQALLQKFGHALREPAHHHPMAWGLTLANWVIKLMAGACLLSAITGSNWLPAGAGALGGELAAIVPLQGPAGFGTYEAGVWAGMATYLSTSSFELTLAVSAALALHVCFLLCAVFAGALAWVIGHVQTSPSRQDFSPPSEKP